MGVILLTLDQKDKTLRCIESFAHVLEPGWRIVLLDNASQDGTLEAVHNRFGEVLTHYSPRNLGVATGRNVAARLAIQEFNPDFLFFLDNDMEVSPTILSALLRALRQSTEIGLATGKILMLEDRKRLYGAGGCYVDFAHGKTGHVGYGETDLGQYDQPRDCLPSGGCMMVKRQVFEKLEGFDAVFDPYGPEDLDFGLRARQAGYRGVYTPEAVLYHESTPGHTFEGGMRSAAYVRNKTRLWFRLMRRHARLGEWVIFTLWGAPLGALRMVIRESRKGNLLAMRGLLGGLLSTERPDKPESHP